MDQNEDKKWSQSWYGWLTLLADSLIFVVPTTLIGYLWWESAFGPPDGHKYRDFRAIAHWFDPILFQYNLVMTLLAVLVVPSLAFNYAFTMAKRKEQRLQHEVPAERRAEIRRRMGRRASFSTYRGSVWLTTIVVLLGTSMLLLLKAVPSADGLGVNLSLGADLLTLGPFAELYEKNPDAYYIHLTRNLTIFQFGFLGAYIYFIGSVARAYFTLDLTSHTFVEGAIRMIVASILALVVSFAVSPLLQGENISGQVSAAGLNNNSPSPSSTAKSSPTAAVVGTDEDSTDNESIGSQSNSEAKIATIPVSQSLLTVMAFFFGYYPKRALIAIEQITLKTIRNIIPDNNYHALPLSMLTGMSYAHELRLEREGFDNVENLSHADAVDLAVRTCFSYSQLKQWIDQAWLASHLREDYPEFAHRTGITTSDELHHFLSACDSAQLDGVEQLVTGLSVDPAVRLSWKVRLTALKILLHTNAASPENAGNSGTNRHGSA